eukprot:7330194-Prymnesium_polylepis.1
MAKPPAAYCDRSAAVGVRAQTARALQQGRAPAGVPSSAPCLQTRATPQAPRSSPPQTPAG